MSAESMNRKLFLKLTLTSTVYGLVGCGSDDGEGETSGGMGTTGNTATSNTMSSTTGGGTNTNTTGSMTSTTGGTTTGTETTGGTTTGGTTTGGGGAGGSGGMGGAGGTGTMGGGGTMNGMGGTGGGSCSMNSLSLEQTSTEPHDHMPLQGTEVMELVMMINTQSSMSLTFQGADQHEHTMEFTGEELTTLAGGGTVTGKVVSEASQPGPHTHTYTISCMG